MGTIPASDHTMKVLIAEDDDDLRRLLGAMVSAHGFEVVEAADGAEALGLIQHEAFPIVITDWLMPRLDGMELIRAIRAREGKPYTYIIMLTGASDATAFRRGMEAGADDLLAKPWRAEELLARLNVARRIMRLQRELDHANRTLRRSNRELEFFRERVMRELEGAARVQESLLPGTLEAVPGLKVSWSLMPCEELAGDVLNVLPLDEHRVALYVLDVSGHGVSAALLSVQLSRLLNPDMTQSQLLRRPINGSGQIEIASPRSVMEELNKLFQMDPTEPQFFTLVYGILDTRAREFRFSSAGHPGPIVVHTDRGPELVVVSGTPIGMLRTGSWTDHAVPVHPGDRLALYSDGIIEASNPEGEMFGDRRLVEIINSGRDLPVGTCCGAVMENLESWVGTRRLQDDCSLLLVEVE